MAGRRLFDDFEKQINNLGIKIFARLFADTNQQQDIMLCPVCPE
jgi:hypothetical protein